MHRSILQTLWQTLGRGVLGVLLIITQWARLEIGFWLLIIGMVVAILGFQAMGIIGLPALIGSTLIMVSFGVMGITIAKPFSLTHHNHPILRMIGQLSRLLLIAIALCISIFGLELLLFSMGIEPRWRYAISFGMGLLLTLFIAAGMAVQQHHRILVARSQLQSSSANALEVQSHPAHWLLRRIQTHSPRLWEEYQDWLHDILLDRDRLLAQGLSPWKVTIVTRWRLLGWSCTVMMISAKRSIDRRS
jgi:hypothetical protein